MATHAHTQGGTTYQLGKALGRAWRGLGRKATRGLVSLGLSVQVAKALLWVVRLVVLGGLLYVGFWVALLVLFAVAAAWCVQDASDEEDVSLFMSHEELRSSIFYDPVTYNDVSHEMYVDD
jgi:hypothetical protein